MRSQDIEILIVLFIRPAPLPYTRFPLRSKGHENQAVEVAWNVLAHNLWVIARQPVAKAKLKKTRLTLAKAG